MAPDKHRHRQKLLGMSLTIDLGDTLRDAVKAEMALLRADLISRALPEPSIYVTTAEAAAIMGVHVKTFTKLAKDNNLARYTYTPKSLHYKRSEVLALAEHFRESEPDE